MLVGASDSLPRHRSVVVIVEMIVYVICLWLQHLPHSFRQRPASIGMASFVFDCGQLRRNTYGSDAVLLLISLNEPIECSLIRPAKANLIFTPGYIVEAPPSSRTYRQIIKHLWFLAYCDIANSLRERRILH